MVFDFGMRQIGVATIDLNLNLASPTSTVQAHHGKPDEIHLDYLVAQWHPAELLVGLPLNMDTTESKMSIAARKFGHYIAKRFNLPVHFIDERLSTKEAADRTKATRPSHALAAVVIAETWLHEKLSVRSKKS